MEQLLNLHIPWQVDPEAMTRVPCLLCGGEGHTMGAVTVNQIEMGIQKCLDDELMWLSPRPGASFYDEMYTKHFYSSICSEQYGYATVEETERRQHKAQLNWNDIEDQCPVSMKKDNFLEIGSATGEMLFEAQKRGWKKAFGNELSEPAANRCVESGYTVFKGDYSQIETNHKFDLIFADNVIEHLMNPLDFVRKIATLLDKNGVVCLRLPNTPDTGPRLKLIDHTFHFNPRSLEAVLKIGGLKVLKVMDSGVYRGSEGKSILNMTVFSIKC